jgi:myo-inositol-1(or 4)-monophosphatase
VATRAFAGAAQAFRSRSQFRMSSPNLHPMLNVAVKAARAAGAIINRAALDVEAVRISQKHVNDFVTEIDHASEQAIIETLLTAYPGHGILAEESGSEHGAKDSDYVWIIDPLDGTTNFIHGFPFYCVSIALSVRGKIEQAVVYDPTRNDLFTATKGRGAYVNDRRIRVSKRTRLSESLVATGFPFRTGDNFKQYLAIMADLMPRMAGLRRPGAAALDLAYVAAGFTDAFFETGLNPWDVAAGSLLVTEAGGLIGNFTGEPDFIDQRECLAGAPRIYGQLVPLLAKYSKFASVDDKLRASDRVRAIAAASKPQTEGSDYIYARSTVTEMGPAEDDQNAEAPAATAAPAKRKLTRIRRDAPAATGPFEGDASAK